MGVLLRQHESLPFAKGLMNFVAIVISFLAKMRHHSLFILFLWVLDTIPYSKNMLKYLQIKNFEGTYLVTCVYMSECI